MLARDPAILLAEADPVSSNQITGSLCLVDPAL